ncbi:DEAD/DEAH box helicase family protein [Thiocapsa marina]|uniref:DEAD/DEAH box helicase family protein n=1 Tax=Thiocapsa marina TaxID=244573 RepID=UPI0002D2FF50|nr:DEAD/DEAH box helicase family protein [Thiocapsa marina]
MVRINIFNISKINSEVRGGKAPRIKRLSEYIGTSYFDDLAGLPDLVLLMDESHRYRASAGIRAINELRPILGLELTATPYVETSRGAVAFKNVIHVNMLKEGWDVTNLYTIVPLRAANARVLIEQSIGRGLRLPYGVRTGVTTVDRLNIVAHDWRPCDTRRSPTSYGSSTCAPGNATAPTIANTSPTSSRKRTQPSTCWSRRCVKRWRIRWFSPRKPHRCAGVPTPPFMHSPTAANPGSTC